MRRPTTPIWVKLTALFALALWLPASSHAWLESVGVIHAVDDDHDADHGSNHEAADGVCRVETGAIALKPPTLAPDILPMVVAAMVTAVCPVGEPPREAKLHRSTAPPELRKVWQFTERTALPGRAPDSLV
jgi:hypothetical protein